MDERSLESRFYQHCGFTADPLYERYEAFVSRYEGRGVVVDIGCGSGAFLDLLSQAGIECLGIDRDPGMAAQAREKGHRVEEGDAVEVLVALRKEGLKAGGVFCAHVVEHMDSSGVLALLGAVRDLLPQSGIVTLLTPNPASVFVHLNEFWRDPTHVRMYNREALEFLVEDSGFSVVASGDNPRNQAYRLTDLTYRTDGLLRLPLWPLLWLLNRRLRFLGQYLGIDRANEYYVVGKKR